MIYTIAQNKTYLRFFIGTLGVVFQSKFQFLLNDPQNKNFH